MIEILLIGGLNIAMFAWFGYLFSKDPANIFKKRLPPTASDNQAGEARPDEGKPPQE